MQALASLNVCASFESLPNLAPIFFFILGRLFHQPVEQYSRRTVSTRDNNNRVTLEQDAIYMMQLADSENLYEMLTFVHLRLAGFVFGSTRSPQTIHHHPTI